MTLELVGLVAINIVYLVVGVAALASLGWVTVEPSTWWRLGTAYPFGLAVLVVPASYLALLEVPVLLTASVVGFAVVVYAVVRRGSARVLAELRHVPRPQVHPVAALLFVVLAVLLVYAARTFATRPVIEWDSWVIWLAKARLLYEDPFAAPAALRSGNYGQAAYPLGLPTIEALGFSAMGRYDGTLIGLQFLALAAAFPLALWSILRTRARSWVIALVAVTVVGAPQIMFQLLTKYADVPLALFVGLGLAAGAAWVAGRRNDPWLLGCFATFLGLAGITKNEGLLFALAGAVALVVAAATEAGRPRLRSGAAAVGALFAIVLPWRLYCAAYGLTTPDYALGHAVSPSYLSDHAGRVGPTVRELWTQLTNANAWGLLTWVILLALVLGAVEARWGLLTFAGTWFVLAIGGLLITYWISVLPVSGHLTNTSDRTIVSLLVGGAAMIPLFVFPRRDGEP